MNTLDQIIHRATTLSQRIVLPEGTDTRIIQAAAELSVRGIAKVTLLGDQQNLIDQFQILELDHSSIDIADPSDTSIIDLYAPVLYTARKHKGMTEQQARIQVTNPLVLGACMVRNRSVDGMVAGATHATADVVRAALQLIGMKPGSKLVSSFFLMEHQLPHQEFQGTAIYADCAMVIDPDAEQLASIAMDTAASATDLAGINPKVALLSFSTAGSAEHANVDKVRAAGEIIAQRQPELALMTEVQFDASIMPQILEAKAPEITVKAPANVFVFPDLQSGNIGYKIAQRIGGVQAIGPILQGLKQPINDLSRGCSIADIVNLVAVTAVQSAQS